MSEPMGEPGVSSGSSDGLVVDEDELEQAHNDHPAEEMTCGSYPEWVGQKVDRAAIEATGKPFRVIKPDSMVTMDHNPDRINVVIDDNEIVLEVKCG
jgi:ribulose-5-phosphate 4-epimerase/fuculose-1-phosphate aldolase